jgi:hypothetical protein
MDPSLDYDDDDDDCHSVQLEGSDMAPRSVKVSFIYLF